MNKLKALNRQPAEKQANLTIINVCNQAEIQHADICVHPVANH